MMRWLIGSGMKLRLVMAAVAVLVIIFGFTQLRETPIDALPEFSRPYVEVQTEALGLSAQEVEALITTPIEADLLNGVSWVEEIRSESIAGLSSIVLVFENDTPMMTARQLVQERLIAIHALPNVSTPPTMLNPMSSASRVMKVGLTSDKLSLIEMSVLARWTITPRLMGVHGVSNVSIWGQRKRQLQIQVDPENLRSQGVTLDQVIKSSGNALWASPLSFLEASTPGTGGWVETPNQRLGIRHLLPITTAEQLKKVTIDGAISKTLGDVATVVEDHQPLIGDAIVDDEPALTLVIEKFPWANTLDVTRGVEKALDVLRPSVSGINLDASLYRPATYLEQAIGNLSTILMIGAALMIVALFAFFFNWRTALISTVSVIVSATAAVGVLYVNGVTINFMIIGGLMVALAALIDDAIADVSNIARRLREENGAKSTAKIIFDACVESRGPFIYATVIMALSIVPVYFIGGVSGAFWGPLANAYLLAVVTSFVVAAMMTPGLSLLLLRGDSGQKASPVAGILQGLYRGLFGWAANAPRPAFIVACVIAVIGFITIPMLRQESLLPDLKETDLVIRFEGHAGASHPAMSRVTSRASRELRALPGVRNVSGHVGRAILSDKRSDVDKGELWVSIDPSANYEQTAAAVREVAAGYPGLSPEVLTYLQARVREELSGSSEALVVRVYGERLNVISEKAEEVKKMLMQVDGVSEATVLHQVKKPGIEIEVDLERSKRYGLKPGDVRRQAATYVSGIGVGSLFEEQKVFDVVVWGTPNTRHSVSSIENLLIETNTNSHVRLKDVADVRIAPTVSVINRDAVARVTDVVAAVSGRDLAAVAADIEARIAGLSFPLEYRAELLGEYAERLQAQQQVAGFAIAALIGIFLLLQAAFGGWRLSTAIFLTLPMALAGGAIAAFLTGGGVVSMGSIIGFFVIFGLAVRNGLSLFGSYRNAEHETGETFGADLVKRVTGERAAPILMTAVTIALVLLPLAFAGANAGLEIIQPMAVIVLGGLITTTLLSLMGVPAMYLLFGEAREDALDLEELPVTVVTEEEAGVAAAAAEREKQLAD